MAISRTSPAPRVYTVSGVDMLRKAVKLTVTVTETPDQRFKVAAESDSFRAPIHFITPSEMDRDGKRIVMIEAVDMSYPQRGISWVQLLKPIDLTISPIEEVSTAAQTPASTTPIINPEKK